jgi:hypothetical protein
MQEDLVYAKTAKGVAEITTRSGALTLAARRVLIMIDGVRPVSELVPLVRSGEFDGILATLKAQGMIELVALSPEQLGDEEERVEPAEVGVAVQGAPAHSRAVETAPVATPPAPPPTINASPPAAAVRPPTLSGARPEAAPRPPTLTGTRAAAADKPVAVAAAPAPKAEPAAARSLEESKRSAVRELYARLGPYGEAPAAKIQECTTLEALREQIQQAFRRVATIRGPQEAQDYLRAIGFAS